MARENPCFFATMGVPCLWLGGGVLAARVELPHALAGRTVFLATMVELRYDTVGGLFRAKVVEVPYYHTARADGVSRNAER